MHAAYEPLSDREIDVLRWVGAGKANKEIARKLGISEETSKRISRIYSQSSMSRTALRRSRSRRNGESSRFSPGGIMETITIILLLLASVVASSAIARAAAVVLPLPLVQIALGALISQIFAFRISLDPEIFLLVFIAPLLFLDGWRIPKEGLFRDKWTIIALAFAWSCSRW